MPAIADALAEWRERGGDRDALWRRLLGYGQWRIPSGASRDAAGRLVISDSTPTGPRLVLTSKQPLVQPLKGRVGEVTANGLEIMQALPAGIDAIVIDPGVPHELFIGRDDLAALQDLVGSIEIEMAWQRLSKGNERADDLARVLRFERYHLAALKRDGVFLMIHVPHDNGEMFVPVFTHGDALSRGLDHVRSRLAAEEVTGTMASGVRAFPAIAKEQAAGFVLNHLGPGKAVAFRSDVYALLLKEIARIEQSGTQPRAEAP